MKNSLKSTFTKAGMTLAALAAFVIPSVTLADSLYRELQFGMSGGDVSTLQTFLAQDRSIYPQGLVTGYFGSLTRSAVVNFQARNGIATVGRVGPITMAAINAQMNGGGTVGFDRVSPSLSQISVSTSASSASISWSTDEVSAGIVYYSSSPIQAVEGPAVSFSGATAIANLNPQLGHVATLSGLSANTNYYVVVYVKDASGNESVSTQMNFRTNN